MITKKVQLIHQPWSIQSTITQDKMAEFLPGIAERMMQNSIYHLSPKFQLYFKIFKKKYRCLKTTDFNRLHIPHYDWNFFIPSNLESCKNWGCQYQIIRQKAHLFKPPSDVYMQVSLWIIIRMVYKWLTAKCLMVSLYR